MATPAAIAPRAPAIDFQLSLTVFCGATGLMGSEYTSGEANSR